MEIEVEAGEKVKIRTRSEEIEGTILKSPENEIILVKLKSGYNIGIKKENVIDVEVLKQEKKKEKIFKIKENKNLPYVDIIMTGGTIASRLDYETGGVKWLINSEELIKFYPELTEIVNIRKIHTPFMKGSENMDYKDWQEIAKICQESLNNKEVKGVIITHGTDFLHYTSSALSFFLRDLNKPVVLTYAQRSSDRASSDAALNLLCAARASVSDIAEVMIVGHGSINDDFCYALRGSKVRKMHTSRRDAFKSVNVEPVAKIFPDGKIDRVSSYNLRNDKKVKLDSVFNDKIALIKFYPGMNPEMIDYLSKNYEGVVVEVSGLGHLAIDESRNNLFPALKKAIANGLIICAASQTIYGRLDPLVYSPGRELLNSGIIFLEDMLAETAYIKLGWVLAHPNWKSKIKEKMLENFASELNDRLQEEF